MSCVRVVGIHPRAEFESRAGLFAALGEAFPSLRFEARDAGALTALGALIELGGDSQARAAAARGIRSLAALAPEADSGEPIAAVLSAQAGIDNRLRGATLPESRLGDRIAIPVGAATEVVARAEGRPIWTREGRLDLAALAPSELATSEPLRARLGRDRSLALLPLLELLRSLGAEDGWRPPPPRASFLLDDPNLHWPSYGHLKLPQLARHAREHGYHLALAMVPLDAWFAHPGAARLLREEDSLSLLVHGNDHFGGELGAIETVGEALAQAAQAQRRIVAFERRAGIRVSRVMAPPHEECSEAVARALARAGFDAITMTRPYPWLAQPPRNWLTAPSGSGSLAGWRGADFTPGNLPVFLRHPLADRHCSSAELVLRAYLDQPLVLYGHHADLAEGLGVLARRTAEVNRLGAVRWSSLGEIAASSFEHRREGDLLRVRPYARRIEVEVPEGVRRVVVEPAPGSGPGDLVRTPAATVALGEPFPAAGPNSLRLVLESPDAVAPRTVPAPPHRPWPIARRLAGEARDRVAPARRLLGSRR